MKIPSQIFEWFEKMKSNYEQSVQSVLDRFEQQNLSQQKRFDNALLHHFANLKQANKMQQEQYDKQISQLHLDIDFYKQQISQQNHSIEKLNSRYDTMVSCLLIENKKHIKIRNIFSDEMFDQHENNEMLSNESLASKKVLENNAPLASVKDLKQTNCSNELLIDNIVHKAIDSTNELEAINNLFEQALNHRDKNEFELSFPLFEQAAQSGHLKAMGASGRAYFLAEGIEEDHTMGLAWLIKAAKQKLPQAVSRVQYFRENDPVLYQKALVITIE